VKIHQNFVDFHKILLKFTKIRMDFQLTNFFGEFYMIFSLSVLGGTVLDRVSSINDIGVMDEKMTFSEHVELMVAKAFTMLGFLRRLAFDFRDSYTLQSLYMYLGRPKLEYASCVWNLFYDVCVDKVERVQRRFIRYALRGLGWTDMHDLPPAW
jgi:hypothetical protein